MGAWPTNLSPYGSGFYMEEMKRRIDLVRAYDHRSYSSSAHASITTNALRHRLPDRSSYATAYSLYG